MKPLRMCMVCRQRKEKQDLIRIAYQKERGTEIDGSGTMPGRGAYLCKTGDCIAQAQRRKALERAFSDSVNPEVYECLMQTAKEAADES